MEKDTLVEAAILNLKQASIGLTALSMTEIPGRLRELLRQVFLQVESAENLLEKHMEEKHND